MADLDDFFVKKDKARKGKKGAKIIEVTEIAGRLEKAAKISDKRVPVQERHRNDSSSFSTAHDLLDDEFHEEVLDVVDVEANQEAEAKANKAKEEEAAKEKLAKKAVWANFNNTKKQEQTNAEDEEKSSAPVEESKQPVAQPEQATPAPAATTGNAYVPPSKRKAAGNPAPATAMPPMTARAPPPLRTTAGAGVAPSDKYVPPSQRRGARATPAFSQFKKPADIMSKEQFPSI